MSEKQERGITRRRLFIFYMIALMGCAFSICISTVTIRRAAKGRTYSDAKEIPHRSVALIMGCIKTLANDESNLFYRNRISAAYELFQAGKVDYFIVSGDNHRKGYDEPSNMKQSLTELGVPENLIYCDYAGFRTLDSIVRAQAIFGQDEITVISQNFHNNRSIYIASHHGIDAIAFNAEDVDHYNSFFTMCREQLARVKTVMDVTILKTKPRFLGPPVIIGSQPPPPAHRTKGSVGKKHLIQPKK